MKYLIMEKFCLKWDDFQKNIGSSFRELQLINKFSDVTLVCEEGQQIEAHKIILSACSPFFKSVLWKNKNLHPMVYMRGLKSKDLLAIVDFMYQGETNILQEDLNGFLALANELQLQGLTGGQKEDSLKNSAGKPKKETQIKHKIPLSKIKSNPTALYKEDHLKGSFGESKENYSSLNTYDQYEPETSNALATLETSDELNEQIAGMMTKSDGF